MYLYVVGYMGKKDIPGSTIFTHGVYVVNATSEAEAVGLASQALSTRETLEGFMLAFVSLQISDANIESAYDALQERLNNG